MKTQNISVSTRSLLSLSSLASVIAISAVTFTAGTTYSTSAKAETEILYNVWLPRIHPFFVGIMKPWKARVEKASNGRIKVKFPAKSLAPPPRQWNLITKGIADMTVLGNNFERKRVTLSMIGQLPFASTTAQKASTSLWATHNKYFAKAGQYKGVKLLGLFGTTGHDFLTKDNKPIMSAADLKGVKMWASAKAQMNALGSAVVALPAPKIFELVSSGVVNGAAVIAYGYNSFRIQKYIKSYTHVPGGIGGSTFSVFMNPKKFDGLSKADKQVILNASGDLIAKDSVIIDTLTTKAVADMKKAGVNMAVATPAFMAELHKTLDFMDKDWVKAANKLGVDGKAALSSYRSGL